VAGFERIRDEDGDRSLAFYMQARVIMAMKAPPDAALFYCESCNHTTGLPGTCFATMNQRGVPKVVGVHAGAHETYTAEALPEMTAAARATVGGLASYVESAVDHIAKSMKRMHARSALTTVCDVTRVPGLREYLAMQTQTARPAVTAADTEAVM
jgi:hypothetical protein